jgi:hypothetical protein
MEKEISLKRSYFISPKYRKKFIKDKEDKNRITIYDAQDTLPKWLRLNTIPSEVKTLFDPIKVYRFKENGSYCEIVHKRDDELNSFENREKRGYFRVIRILSFPTFKELPPKLIKVLEEKKYKKVERTNQGISDLEEKFIA